MINQFVEEVINTRGAILIQNYHILLVIIGAVIYLISPIDLIPEIFFGIFGLFDDILVMIYAVAAVAGFFFRILEIRGNQQARAHAQ